MKDSSTAGQREAYQRVRGLQRHEVMAKKVEKSIKTLKDEDALDIDALLAERGRLLGVDSAPEANAGEEKDIRVQARELASQLGTEEEVKELAQEAYSLLLKFMRSRQRVVQINGQLLEAVEKLVRRAHASVQKESGQLWRTIAKYETEIAKTNTLLEEAAEKNPIAFQTHWLLKLREQKRQFNQTGVIETDAIAQQTAKLMDDVRRKLEGTNGVIALLGPTGSGKSVIAKKIASKFSSNGEFEFVSAHPKMTADDLIERMGIVIESTPAEKIPALVKKVQSKFKKEHLDMEAEELAVQLGMIEQVILQRESQKVLETKKVLEAVGRAARDGKIVVIDEFNYLPPDTLASLNDLLAGGTSTKEGFGVIFTGNIGKEYIKRQNLDPALINRILSGTVEYGFPPQELNRAFSQSVISREEQAVDQKPPDRDLYQIALIQLLDEKGNLLAPEGALESTWDLARIVALTQHIAAGKDFRDLGIASPATQGVTAMKFENVFLSFRNLNQVVREWKLDGYTKPLEWYVFADVIRPASVLNPKEAAQLFFLFQTWGGMFGGDEWKDIVVDSITWRIAGIKKIREPHGQETELKPYLPSEVVEAISGRQLPSYDTLESTDALDKAKKEAEKDREMARMEAEEAALRRAFEEEPNVIELCAELEPVSA
ncbi:MAG: AAA family ATPase [Candidatus Uhrbacteria bacterium]|nr:AAA family ATPase [Candidatus Uhrbacteria bacterium]